MACYHGADECPDKCMCPCDLCDLLRTDAYTGDAIDAAASWLEDGDTEGLTDDR